MIVEAAMAKTAVGFAVPEDKLRHGYTHSLPSMETELCAEETFAYWIRLKLKGRRSLIFHWIFRRSLRCGSSSFWPKRESIRTVILRWRFTPGSGVKKRSWPAERYAEVADRIAEHESCPIVLLGGRGKTYDGTDESAVVERLHTALKSLPLISPAGWTCRNLPGCSAAVASFSVTTAAPAIWARLGQRHAHPACLGTRVTSTSGLLSGRRLSLLSPRQPAALTANRMIVN